MVQTIVPVTPLAGAFIRLKAGDVIRLEAKCVFGSYLRKLAKKRYYKTNNLPKHQYSDQIVVDINQWYLSHDGFSFTDEAVHDFNKYVTNLFYEVYLNTIDFYLTLHPDESFMKIYDLFIDKYELDPEIFNYERLKKKYYRFRKSSESSIILIEKEASSVPIKKMIA